MKRTLSFIALMLIMIPLVYSLPLIPTGNILLKDKYGIDGATHINSTLYCDNSGTCGTVPQFLVASSSGNTTTQMINAVNNTALNGSNFVSVAWNNLVGRLITSVQSKWFSTPSGVLTFDEAELNATIDARDTDTTYSEDSDYLTQAGTVFGFDESVLNATIDARDTDTTYSEDSDYLTQAGTVFGLDESVLNATIDVRDTNLSNGGNVAGNLVVSGDVNATSYRNVEIQNKADGQTWVVFQ